MKYMTSAEVRRSFLDFFVKNKHREVASSSLVPGNDPTLLFANSGMVQFKDVFLGTESRDYSRATTSQKCMRVSGKHNDLEDVGPSARHHTFFEMLGNFSFGDYFKLEAMKFAWELVTEVYGMPEDRLAVTIYEKDDESFELWADGVGVPVNRIARLGPDENFWQMADTGPCGPNSEIFWDQAPEKGEDSIIASLEADDDRFLEFWNLVFMQFSRTQPDKEHTGKFDVPLPSPGVDTGMGLERMTKILQNVETNYETDLFTEIMDTTQRLAGATDAQRSANVIPYRVIADHVRAAVFLISDGVLPGAKGRDSVCRLVIRRAARFGAKLGFQEPFLAEVAGTVIDLMGDHYIDLKERGDAIQRTITREEERFHRTMDNGVAELEAMLDDLPEGGVLPGKSVFHLKATLGLPIQVTKDIAEERGYSIDEAGFEAAEKEHAEISGGGTAMGEIESGEFYSTLLSSLQSDGKLPETGVEYEPYGPTSLDSELLALVVDGEQVNEALNGDRVEVVLSKTPFYVESGGQVSDIGAITGDGWRIEVDEMRRPVGGMIVHIGEVVEGTPKIGDALTAKVDAERRGNIVRNHTGTHLLHAALRNRLGNHVQQRGSLVAPDRLRFDFAHDAKVGVDELTDIEAEVNNIILKNYPVRAEVKSLQQARSEGAMALFGEKYGDTVRTIIIENGSRYSYELCGGVHVQQTNDIGLFVIINEGSVSAGVRRIEALTGKAAIEFVQNRLKTLGDIAFELSTTPDDVVDRLKALQNEVAEQRRQIDILRRDLARYTFDEMIEKVENVNGVPALFTALQDTPMDTLREMSDWFRGKVKSGVFVAGTNVNEKPLLMVAVTDDLTKKGLHAGNIVREAAKVVGGGGGGRPNLAEAGGKDSSKMNEALEKAREVIAESYNG